MNEMLMLEGAADARCESAHIAPCANATSQTVNKEGDRDKTPVVLRLLLASVFFSLFPAHPLWMKAFVICEPAIRQ